MKKTFSVIENFDTAPESALLSLRAAGAIAERSRASLYRDNKQGRLPFQKVGCSTRIRVGDLRRFMAAGESEAVQ